MIKECMCLMIVSHCPVDQMLRRARVQAVLLRHPHVNDPPLVVGMDQLVSPLPLPVRGVLLRPLAVYPADQAGDGDPEYQGDHDHRPHHVVLQELEEAAHADLVDEVPDADDVLTGLLAHALVAEALEARGPVRENIHGRHGVAGAVEVAAAAALAGVRAAVAHAALLALGLAEGDTLPRPALALLYAVGPVSHVLGLGAGCAHSCKVKQSLQTTMR